jgi:DNA-binding NarL/FixJ family response regulator
MVTRTIRVLIADDHPLVRRGIRNILSTAPEMKIVGEATDGADVVVKVVHKRPDVVVLDISMPHKSGLEVLGDLKRKLPKLPILILSVHSEARFADPAFRAGADAYIKKEYAAEELLDTIRRLAARN